MAGHGEAAWRALAQLITALENGSADAKLKAALHDARQERRERPCSASPAPAAPASRR